MSASETRRSNTDTVSKSHGPAAHNRRRIVYGYVAAIVLIALFVELGHHTLPRNIFPSVEQIVESVGVVFKRHGADLALTLIRLLVAVLSASVVGWVIGLLMGAFRNTIALVVGPILTIMQAIPSLSWVLVASLAISNIETRIWLICFTIGLPLYAISVFEGIRNLDGELVEAVDQFRPNKFQIIRYLFVPQSIVYVLISMRAVSSIVLRILVFAELIAATAGVGAKMGDAQFNFDISMIFALTAVMVIANFLIVGLIDYLEFKLLPWRREGVVR